jgi:hypothetical protein
MLVWGDIHHLQQRATRLTCMPRAAFALEEAVGGYFVHADTLRALMCGVASLLGCSSRSLQKRTTVLVPVLQTHIESSLDLLAAGIQVVLFP